MIIDIDDNDPWPPANLPLWTRYPLWHRAEAAALLHGREPQAARADSGDYASTALGKAVRGSAAEASYWDLLSLMDVANEAGELNEPERPSNVLRWAERMELPFPAGLRAAIRFERATPAVDEVSVVHLRNAELQAENAKLREQASAEMIETSSSGITKRLRSHQTLLLALAVDKFRFDPRAARGPAVTNILNALARVGLKLDPGTVLSILRDAYNDIGLPAKDQLGADDHADDADAVLPKS